MPISHAESALFFIPSNNKYFKLVSLELYVLSLKIINIFKIKVPKIVRYMDPSKNSVERIKFNSSLTYFF